MINSAPHEFEWCSCSVSESTRSSISFCVCPRRRLTHPSPALMTSTASMLVVASAGALDGVDQWESLKSTGVTKAEENDGLDELTGDGANDPRTEMLYNWDSYLLSSMDGL